MDKFKWVEICPEYQLVVIMKIFRVAMDDEPLDLTEREIYEAIISELKKEKDNARY